MSKLEIRPLSLDDDLDAQLDLVERAFGVTPPADREAWLSAAARSRVTDGRCLGAFLDGRPVGSAYWHDMRQWWAGRALPMAGVAGVKIAPEARGRGLGRQLMSEVLRAIAARGYPLSALYPATMPIYRSLGWELAGSRYTAVIPARSLRSLASPDLAPGPDDSAQVEFRKAAPGDGAELISVLGRVHEARRDCGPLTRDVAAVEHWLVASPDTLPVPQPGRVPRLPVEAGHPGTGGGLDRRGDPGGRAGRVVGPRRALVHRRHRRGDHLAGQPHLVAAARAGRPAHQAPACGCCAWSTRQAAMARRGFGRGVAGSVRMLLRDQQAGEGRAVWSPTRRQPGLGAYRRERTGATGASGGVAPGALTVGARGLAALYAGTPVPTLRLAGLAAGGSPADDEFLAAAFPGPAWMIDNF